MKSDRNEFAGRRVTVMGLGLFGGGVAVVRYLIERGARVTLTDLRTEAELTESLRQLDETPPARLYLGGHREEDFTQTDLVVVNPAVRPDNRYVQLARRHGVTTTSEIRLFWQHKVGRIVGVTGSNGKSTTAALIHSMLEADGRPAWLGGNIGKSLLSVVDQIRPDDWVVLELSSFQLQDLDVLQDSPPVAVVTSFSPNHLDWHQTLHAYRDAKQSILRWQQPEDLALLSGLDEVANWPTRAKRRLFAWTDESVDLPADGMVAALDMHERKGIVNVPERRARFPLSHCAGLTGVGSWRSATAAVATAVCLEVGTPAIRRALESYAGLPHRLQFVGEIAGRRCYDDSASTTPESTIAALESIPDPVLILGGADKGTSFEQLARFCVRRAKAVILIGSAGPKLSQELQSALAGDAGGGLRAIPLPVDTAKDLREALGTAIQRSVRGESILLSPACASFGMFRNFEERGQQFAQLVEEFASVEPE